MVHFEKQFGNLIESTNMHIYFSINSIARYFFLIKQLYKLAKLNVQFLLYQFHESKK